MLLGRPDREMHNRVSLVIREAMTTNLTPPVTPTRPRVAGTITRTAADHRVRTNRA